MIDRYIGRLGLEDLAWRASNYENLHDERGIVMQRLREAPHLTKLVLLESSVATPSVLFV